MNINSTDILTYGTCYCIICRKDVAILLEMWEEINILFKDIVLCKQASDLKTLIGDFRNFYVRLEDKALQVIKYIPHIHLSSFGNFTIQSMLEIY